MKKLTVDRAEREQRLNKYLQRKLPDSPSSFIYKMLRKKNITLNGKKASGSELLKEGDLVTLFLSDETIAKFGGRVTEEEESGGGSEKEREYLDSFRALNGRIGTKGILYEDDHILAVRKPVGVLSQKSADSDRSMNEWLVGYLIETGQTDVSSLREFTPSVCNRLDRNTGGILLCAKTLAGARKMAQILRDRTLHKYYQAAVLGQVSESGVIEGYLFKDRVTNTVSFRNTTDLKQEGRAKDPGRNSKTGSFTKTTYRALKTGARCSLLEMELITGKTHQIRSHLSSAGHPILGDPKYGDTQINQKLRSVYGVRGQMLWCSRVEFPVMEDELAPVSNKVINCDPPSLYREIVDYTE